MPRAARKKSSEAMYHVMSRSISEVDLFQCDEDKDYYLSLLKRYKEKYHCKIYAYCLMTNHVHIYINPCGYDISSFMHSLNTAYVTYFNKKYKRHGHLFQGRFASTIVDNITYSLTLTAYIHNNAKDIPAYSGKEETYPHSSYGIYTGYRNDIDDIVDTEFILKLFGNDEKTAKGKYKIFNESMRDTGIMKEIDENIMLAYVKNEYRNEKNYIIRNRIPDELIRKISDYLKENFPEDIRGKYNRKASKFRAITTYVMRVLCGYTYKKICEYVGNMSMSGISRLANEGFKLLHSNVKYREAFNLLIN